MIIELYRLGNDPLKIREVTKYPKSTIYEVIKRYKEKGITKRKDHPRRKDIARTEDLRQFVKTLWQPSMSIRSLARQTNVSITTMLRAIREDMPQNQTTVQHKGCKKTKIQVKHDADEIDGYQQGSEKGRFGEFPCDICKKVLSSYQVLEDHMRTHSGEKPFACPYCDYHGSSSSLLAHHKRQRHKEERKREEKEKEKKRDKMVQRYVHKSVKEEPTSGEVDKKEKEPIRKTSLKDIRKVIRKTNS